MPPQTRPLLATEAFLDFTFKIDPKRIRNQNRCIQLQDGACGTFNDLKKDPILKNSLKNSIGSYYLFLFTCMFRSSIKGKMSFREYIHQISMSKSWTLYIDTHFCHPHNCRMKKVLRELNGIKAQVEDEEDPRNEKFLHELALVCHGFKEVKDKNKENVSLIQSVKQFQFFSKQTKVNTVPETKDRVLASMLAEVDLKIICRSLIRPPPPKVKSCIECLWWGIFAYAGYHNILLVTQWPAAFFA